jgi:hypothetical protein
MIRRSHDGRPTVLEIPRLEEGNNHTITIVVRQVPKLARGKEIYVVVMVD